MKNRLVLISGQQGSGKTTLADGIHNHLMSKGKTVAHLSFASTIYAIHDFALKQLKECGIERDIKKDGYLLQLLGTEWGRSTINENIWVNCTKGKVEKDRHDFNNLYNRPLIHLISDCRFKNEFDLFPDALRVRLECSEEVRKERCSMWRETTNHPSECDLDDYIDKFDMVVDTENYNSKHALSLVLAQIEKDTWLEKRK